MLFHQGVPASARGKPSCSLCRCPHGAPLCRSPSAASSLGIASAASEGASSEPHVRVTGPRRTAAFPRVWGFVLGFSPALLAGSAVTHATARTGPAPSPPLPLPGRAQALRFPPQHRADGDGGSRLHSFQYKRRGKTALHTGRWPTVSWQLRHSIVFPIVLTETRTPRAASLLEK